MTTHHFLYREIINRFKILKHSWQKLGLVEASWLGELPNLPGVKILTSARLQNTFPISKSLKFHQIYVFICNYYQP